MRATERILRQRAGSTNASLAAQIGATDAGAVMASLTGVWDFIGPQPITERANFTGTSVGNSLAMAGRITSVEADASGLIVVGAASGGVWLSTDSGGSFASVFDNQPTIAIGAVALDTTTNPSTIYVGTGEGNNSVDSLYGAGIFRSTDVGQSWTQLGPAGTFDRGSFTSIAVDTSTTPRRLFAGVTSGFSASRADAGISESDVSKSGLWLSSDGGDTWGQYPESFFDNCDLANGTNAPCPADDVKIDPTNQSNVYVAIDSSDVYYSNDGGITFKAAVLPTAPIGSGHQSRQSLAVGPPAPAPIGPNNPPGGTVYAMIGAADGAEYSNLFVSFDAGATWNAGTTPPPVVPQFSANGTTIDGTNSANFSQSFYDQAMLVSPTDPATVYFGGVGLYASSNYGNSWTFLGSNGGIHSDQHALTWDPATSQILVGNDGGLYRFDPTQGLPPAFTSFNDKINTGQIQGIGAHPTDATKLIAGFQDNGTQLFNGGVATWFGPDSETGDGGFVFYDLLDPTFLYHDFSLDQINHAQISASSDSGQHWCSAPAASPPACNVNDVEWTPSLQNQITNVAGDPGPAFYAPLAVDPTSAHRVLFGAHSVYVSTDGMAHWGQQTDSDLTGFDSFGNQCPIVGPLAQQCSLEDLEFGPVDGFHGHPAWALAMSTLDGTFAFAINNTTQANFQVDPNDPNSHGGFWTDVTSNLDTFLLNSSPQSNGVFSTQATGIGLDPFYSGVAYIALSGFTADTLVGHIYKTTDFGTNWKEADGNAGTTLNPTGLPDVPVLKILVDATDSSGTCGGFTCSNSLFAGTDIGIFHSSDGGATWQPFNLGVIPPVPVYDMAQNSTGVIFAGTHGRGAFRFIPATPTATATPTPTATATPNGAKIIAPAAVTLGPIGIGVGQSTRNIVIRNSGKVGNLIGGVALNSPSQVFSFSPTTFNLAPGKLQPVAVTFNPDVNSSSATTPAMATITSNDATRGALQLKLTGRGLAGRLTVARTVTLVGPANQTTPLNLTIRNSGRGILSGSWSSVSSPPYSVNGNLFGPLQPGGTTTIPVSFSPTAKGRVPTTAPLTISVNLPSTGGTTVTLRGLGK